MFRTTTFSNTHATYSTMPAPFSPLLTAAEACWGQRPGSSPSPGQRPGNTGVRRFFGVRRFIAAFRAKVSSTTRCRYTKKAAMNRRTPKNRRATDGRKCRMKLREILLGGDCFSARVLRSLLFCRKATCEAWVDRSHQFDCAGTRTKFHSVMKHNATLPMDSRSYRMGLVHRAKCEETPDEGQIVQVERGSRK